MNWTFATGIVAVYGATLSTWKVVSDHLEKRRSITVKITWGFETYGTELGPQCVLVTAMNTGHRTVTLRSAGLRLPNGRDMVNFLQSGDARFPHELHSGQSCMISIPVEGVRDSLIRAGIVGKIWLTGFFRDALDKTYRSERFEFDVNSSTG